jgi:hypothetical protein
VKRLPIVAILLYVTLDLSVAEMPGAFVFDPAGSVESVQPKIGRADSDLVGAPVVATGPCARPLSRMEVSERSSSDVTCLPSRPIDHLPRQTLEPSPLTEDSH